MHVRRTAPVDSAAEERICVTLPQRTDSTLIPLGPSRVSTLVFLPAWHRRHYLRPLDRLAFVRRKAYLPKQCRLGIVLVLLAKSRASLFFKYKTCAVHLHSRYAAHAWLHIVQKRISWRWHLLACYSSTASSDHMQSSQRASKQATTFKDTAHVQASFTSSHFQATSPRLARQLVSLCRPSFSPAIAVGIRCDVHADQLPHKAN